MESNQIELNTLSEDVFDQLLGDAPPESSVNETTIIGGSQDTEDTEDEVVEEVVVKKSTKKQSKAEPEQKEVNVEEDINSLIEDSEEVSTEDTDSSQTPESTKGQNDLAEFFKAQYEGLVQRGLWDELDEESLKDFEWTEENYGALIESQAQWKAENKFNERLEASGYYGKAIFDYIEKGGNPEDMISLFQEMKEIGSFDTSSESGKLQLLRRYYVEELGWPEAKFTRNSKEWIDSKVVDEEVTFVQEKLNEEIQQKVADKRVQLEAYQEQQKQAQLKFAKNINDALGSRKDIALKERNEIISDLLNYNQKLPDGRVVNKFTLDFMKLQADPKDYIDLVLFVKNKDKYVERISKEVASETNKKNWNLIKGGAAISKTSSTKQQAVKKEAYKGTKFDYRSILDS